MRRLFRTVFAGILIGGVLGLAGIAVAVAAQQDGAAIQVRQSNAARGEAPAAKTAAREAAQNRQELRKLDADQRGNGPLRRAVRGDRAFAALEPYGTTAVAAAAAPVAEVGWMDLCPGIPPLSAALHIQPPLGVDHGEKDMFDASIHEFVVVSICKLAPDGGCDPVKEFTAGGPGNGLNQIVLQDSRYHVNWHGMNKKAMYEIRFLVGDFEIGLLRYSPGSAGTVPIKFRIDNHPLLRARVLYLMGMSASDTAAAVVSEFGLGSAPLCVAGILKEVGFGCVDIGMALFDVFAVDPENNAEILRDIGCSVIDITIVLRDVYGLTPENAAQILKRLGFSAVDIATALRDVYSLDALAVATILNDLGFSVIEIGTVLRDVFSLDPLEAANVLKEVGFSATDVGLVLRDVYELSAAEAAQILTDAGYTPSEIAIMLRDVYNQNALGVVLILRDVGATPVQIGEVLRDVFEMSAMDAAELMRFVDYSATDVGSVLMEVYSLDAAEAGAILRDIGYTVIDIATVFRDVYSLSAEEAAQILMDLGYSAVEIGTALRDVYSLDALAVATILKDIGFSVTEVGTVLQEVFSLDALAAVMVLEEIGYTANEVGIVLRDVYEQTAAEAAATLADAGYTPTEIAMVLRDVYEQSALDIVLIMRDAGASLIEVGVVLRDVFGEDAEGAAKIMNLADYSATDVGTVLKDVYSLDAADAVDALAGGGYSFLEIGVALRDVYILDAFEAAALLDGKGYAARKIQEVIILVYDAYAAIVDVQVLTAEEGQPEGYTGVSFDWPCTGSNAPCTDPYIPGILGEFVPPSDVNTGIGGDTVYIWVKYDLVNSASDTEVLVDIGAGDWDTGSDWIVNCPSGSGPAPGSQGGRLTTGAASPCLRIGLCVQFAPMNLTDTFIANLSLSLTDTPEANCPALCGANLSAWPLDNDLMNIHEGCNDGMWMYLCASKAQVQPPAVMEIDVTDAEKAELLVNHAPRVWLATGEAYFPSSVDYTFPFLDRVIPCDEECGAATPPVFCADCGNAGFDGNWWWLQTKDQICGSDVLDYFHGCDGDPARCMLSGAPVYAFWKEKQIPVGDEIFEVADLVYFLYFPYNEGEIISATSFGNHVGDWEQVSVRMMRVYDGSDEWPLEPVQIRTSSRGLGRISSWDDIQTMNSAGGEHPLVYAALGSHGIYQEPGDHVYGQIIIGIDLIDETGPGTAWDTWLLVETFDFDAMAGLGSSVWPSWMSPDYTDPSLGDSDPASGPIYRWGNMECGSALGTCVLCDGPLGPIDSAAWTSLTLK